MTAAATRTTRPLTAAVLRLAAQPRTASREDDLAAQFVATVDTQLRVLLDQQRNVPDLDDPEAVHQMRVAIRRMRVALRIGADALGALGAQLRAELGWLGGELGVVRDLDVLAGRLAIATAHLGPADQAGAEEVRAALHEARVAAREILLDTLAEARYRDLLRALARLLRAEPPAIDTPAEATRPADPLELLDRPLRKLRREVAAAGDEPTDDQLHTLRIRGKRLRYAAELASGLCGRSRHKQLRRLIGAAKDLQEVLGDHHDTVTAEAWLRESVTGRSAPALLVAGRLLERELAQRAALAQQWPLAWRELDRRARDLT